VSSENTNYQPASGQAANAAHTSCRGPAGVAGQKESVNIMKTFRISTDAVTTGIEAANEDDAAAKFARNEPVYVDYIVNCVADLIFAAKKLGGWANVEEI
jgi:hypothetical protein